MDPKYRTGVILGLILAAMAGLWVTEIRSPAQPNAQRKEPVMTDPAPVKSIAPARVESFEERLRTAQSGEDKNAASQRPAILIEWLASDRVSALGFLARNRFRDLALPGVSKAVGEKVSVAELLAIANAAENPHDAIYEVGKWANPEAINGLSNQMASVSAEAAGPTASALGGLLTTLNLDRAVVFALNQASDPLRSWTMSGVFDQLRSTANGDAEIRSIYASLPATIRTADPVLFSYGNGVWGSDPAAALLALQSISSPETRTMALVLLSQNAASASPEIAIAALYASGLSEQGIYNHVSQILRNWNAVDPRAATDFLSTTQLIPGSDVAKYKPLILPRG